MTNVHTLDSSSASGAQEDTIITEAKAILDRRLFTRSRQLQSPDEVRDYLKLKLASEPNEVFAAIFMDTRHRVIAFEAIVAHNHPSGDTEASLSDYRLTQRLIDALALLDIRILDHFIVGKGELLSLAETGRINFSTAS